MGVVVVEVVAVAVVVVLHLHAYAYCSSNDSVMITMWPSCFFDLLTVVMRVK